MLGKRGGIQRGNKVATRNYKSLKVIDLRIVLLEPSGLIKTTSNYLIIRWLLVSVELEVLSNDITY